MGMSSLPVYAQNEAANDHLTKTQLLITYHVNPRLSGYPINLKVINGVATLSGTVDSIINKSLAEEIARAETGVNKVINNIKIDSSIVKSQKSSYGQKVIDLTTTANILGNLHSIPSLANSAIVVVTSHGVVTLSGTVTNADQKDLAASTAQQSTGVTQVINNLQIVNQATTE